MLQIGTDIVFHKTFNETLQTGGESLLKKLFTPQEIEQHKTLESLAGIYAAKEAIIKALPDQAVPYSSITITKNAQGKPVVLMADENKRYNICISISHDGDYSIAMVVITD